jgi:predicted RNA binding protein YcfA (HicA-like mRNA interferase family)
MLLAAARLVPSFGEYREGMPKLPHVTGREILAALLRGGFTESHVKGSHHYLRRDGGPLVVVPVHAGETVPPGTLKSILRNADLSVDAFVELL